MVLRFFMEKIKIVEKEEGRIIGRFGDIFLYLVRVSYVLHFLNHGLFGNHGLLIDKKADFS